MPQQIEVPGMGIVEFPDGMSDGDIAAAIQRSVQPQAPSEPTVRQKVQASLPGRTVQGMRDPIDAVAQMLPHALEKVTSVGGFAPNPVSQFFGDEAKRVDQINAQNEKEYQASRQATGQEGFDGARLAGNIVSPANAAIAARLPMTAATTTGKVGYGFGVGGAGGLLTPVNDMKEGQSYWGTKAAQAGMGAITGAIATPIMSKIGEAIVRRVNMRNPDITGPRSVMETDRIIKEALEEVGQKIDDLPQQHVIALRQQVSDALKQGKKLDPAAMLRKQDFELLNIPHTQGQITRDATQFAKERNLRGVAGVGEPILNRFELQNKALQSSVAQFGGDASNESYQAGVKLADTLKNVDDSMRGKVSSLYSEARASSGKDLNVPLSGLAQDYAETLRNFGDKVPSGVRTRMEELGLLSGKQRKVFTIEDAEGLLKTINDNVSNDPATNKALDTLRNAVKNAVLSADDQGGVFAKAREAAAMRFQMHDAIPALKSASIGATAPDDFVKRYVVSGKTREVQELAKLLKSADPDAYQEARNQIGATLQRAAFGENTSGDKIFSPERYAKALRDMGSEKLSAFYSPDEITKLKALSRVGAYINSTPSAAPVNTSNTAGAAANVAGWVPGVPVSVQVAKSLLSSAKNVVGNRRAIAEALAAQPPVGKADLTPEQISMMVKLLAIGGASAGGAAASPLR